MVVHGPHGQHEPGRDPAARCGRCGPACHLQRTLGQPVGAGAGDSPGVLTSPALAASCPARLAAAGLSWAGRLARTSRRQRRAPLAVSRNAPACRRRAWPSQRPKLAPGPGQHPAGRRREQSLLRRGRFARRIVAVETSPRRAAMTTCPAASAPAEAEVISLYDAIGGRPALVAAVDGLDGRLLADPELSPLFPDGAAGRYRRYVVTFFVRRWAGPDRGWRGARVLGGHQGQPPVCA